MEDFNLKPRRVIHIPIRKILKVVFIILVVIGLYAFFSDYLGGGFGMRGPNLMNIPNPLIRDTGSTVVDATDTREFLKVRYDGMLRTRDVSSAMREVKGAIREFEGRIDNESTAPKSGSVRFVVPKSTFEAFRDDIESITHAKLYTEQISSQNLLGQKQNIENQMNIATATLADLQIQKETLDAQHLEKLSTLQAELRAVAKELATVRFNLEVATDTEKQASFRTKENLLIERQSTFYIEQNKENASYTGENNKLTSQIVSVEDDVTNVEMQDESFTNNVETVEGYVTVRWISLWGMAVLFSPVHPALIIFLLVMMIWFHGNRRGYLPRVEFS